MDYDNTNTGALFKAEKATEKHPDYTGSINVGGTEFWLSAWIKKSKSGQNFMSLTVKEKEKGKKKETKKPVETTEEDLPF